MARIEGHKVPHVFRFYRRTEVFDDPLQPKVKLQEQQTVVQAKFLSKGYIDPSPVVLVRGEPSMLPDPTPIPPFALPYDKIQEMVNIFFRAGEFNRSDVDAWKQFIMEHETKIRSQCEICVEFRMEEASIGTIRTTKLTTDAEKEHARQQQYKKKKIQEKMAAHLTTSDLHAPLVGWWTSNALPKAGSDLPYITIGHSIEDLARIAANQCEMEQEMQVEVDLDQHDCDMYGRLHEPSTQMINVKGGTKHVEDIALEMANSVSSI